MVKNPPANARDMGSVPGPGRVRMLQGNKARVPQLLSLCSKVRALEQEASLQGEAFASQLEKAHMEQRGPRVAKNEW